MKYFDFDSSQAIAVVFTVLVALLVSYEWYTYSIIDFDKLRSVSGVVVEISTKRDSEGEEHLSFRVLSTAGYRRFSCSSNFPKYFAVERILTKGSNVLIWCNPTDIQDKRIWQIQIQSEESPQDSVNVKYSAIRRARQSQKDSLLVLGLLLWFFSIMLAASDTIDQIFSLTSTSEVLSATELHKFGSTSDTEDSSK